jgi:hypothetical protein
MPTSINADDVVLTMTTRDLVSSENLIHFDKFTLFVQAIRVDRKDNFNAQLTGSLFTHISALRPGTCFASPKCILGTDPCTPARIAARLVTHPDGPPEGWKPHDVLEGELIIEIPACEPWIPTHMTVRLKARHQTTAPDTPMPSVHVSCLKVGRHA